MNSRALVFDLYGQYFRYQPDGAARLQALTAALQLFDVEPATVRATMTRLRKDGWFTSSREGREVSYAPSERTWRLLDHGRTRIYGREGGAWQREWTQALVTPQRASPAGLRRIATALRWWGFGQYAPEVWFSPHDRRIWVGEMLEGGDAQALRFLHSRTGSLLADRQMAEHCWDLPALSAAYQEFIDAFTQRLPAYRRGVPGAQAVVERMRLLQAWRRYPFHDPDLPEELLPSDWRGSAAHALFLACEQALATPAAAQMAELATDM
ncbi:MAG: hypothetical protein OZ923_08480 [Comamonadaceae bacterium]|nr:hypothetical protein [Burkholderiales bacterium]MEB2348636.1 hypothetical protein [Comamonadaceae bacterium]